MPTLAIDIETYSSVELKTAGEHAYAAAPDFSLLLFGYAFDDERVEVVDVARGERIPREVIDALTDPRITKTAFNAAFERACISRALRLGLPPEQWLCTMAWSLYLGLPRSLAKVGAALELDAQKDPAGEKLIKLFCTPKRRDLFGSGRTLPEHAPDQWERFIAYCRRDVEVEREIRRRLASRPMPEIERRVWAADQRINDRGVYVDLDLAGSAVAMDEAVSERLAAEARDITGLKNPSAVAQLRPWVESRLGRRLANLDKKVIAEVLEETRDPDVRRALELRLLLGKSSTKKYLAVESSACPDRRARGLLQYYGAARTGRWGGRRIQPQNMAKSKLADLDAAREAVKFGDVALVEALYGEVPDVLSQLVRTTLTAAPGHYLISSDFSAIEARVVAWLAGEKWVLDVFRRGEGLYEATASQMFGVPIEKVTKDLRTKGKVATLACIAEGELILTPSGLIPIEEITTEHLVWDGVEFVAHDGVVFRGERETISYDGLTATPDHLVWIEGESRPVQLQYAAACGARLVQSGAGRTPIRVGEDYISGEAIHSEGVASSDGAHGVHWMWAGSMDLLRQPEAGVVEGVPSLLTAKSDTALARSEAHRGEAAMRKPERPALPQLRREGDSIQLPERDRSGLVDPREPRHSGPEFGDRSDRQQRALRTGESSIHDAKEERGESEMRTHSGMGPERMAVCPGGGVAEDGGGHDARGDLRGCPESGTREAEKLARHRGKVRVYDIVNAGPRNRFTASGKLVHNCGYGGGLNALVAMGALKMGLAEHELRQIVDQWRAANARIVAYWRAVESAAVSAICGRPRDLPHGVRFEASDGALRVRLPAGRELVYIDARVESDPRWEGRQSITYRGADADEDERVGARIKTYGGKLVENITQAVARDCLAETLLRLEVEMPEAPVVLHIHDEVVLEVPDSIAPDDAISRVVEIMRRPMPWAPDLPLDADAFATPYYRADD